MSRVVIIGGPCSGKSSLARQLGLPTWCSDPISKVRAPQVGVTYLREGLTWSEASEHVARNWLTMPGPWCIEGVALARALRKWIDGANWAFGLALHMPCDRIIVLRHAHPDTSPTKEQRAMGKGVFTVWDSIAHHFEDITEERQWKQSNSNDS